MRKWIIILISLFTVQAIGQEEVETIDVLIVDGFSNHPKAPA